MAKISIIGCGWLGIRLGQYLVNTHQVCSTTTSASKLEKLQQLRLNPQLVSFADDSLLVYQQPNQTNSCEVVIISVPFSINTDIQKLQYRFANLSTYLNGYNGQLFLLSSIGIYPQLDMTITESSLPEQQLNPNILLVEKLLQANFAQINILRLAGLMGDDRYLAKYFTNGNINQPNQAVNHIHYQDICTIVSKMIELNLSGKTYNLVAPLHPSKQQVVDYQNGSLVAAKDKINSIGRQVNGDKLIADLDYTYQYDDPRIFENTA